MLAAGQVEATDRAVRHQLTALLPPGHLHLAAAAPVASAAVLLPPGHLHLAAAAPVASAVLLPPGLQHLAVASAASLRQWTTLTPSATRPLLLIPSPTRLPPAWLPFLMLGLRRRMWRRTSACEPT